MINSWSVAVQCFAIFSLHAHACSLFRDVDVHASSTVYREKHVGLNLCPVAGCGEPEGQVMEHFHML